MNVNFHTKGHTMRCLERGYAKDKAFRNIYISPKTKGCKPDNWAFRKQKAAPVVVIPTEEYNAHKQNSGNRS